MIPFCYPLSKCEARNIDNIETVMVDFKRKSALEQVEIGSTNSDKLTFETRMEDRCDWIIIICSLILYCLIRKVEEDGEIVGSMIW